MNDEYMRDELFDELLVSVREGGDILRGMKKDDIEDEMRPEYDLKALRVRRVGAERMKRGDHFAQVAEQSEQKQPVLLDADVWGYFQSAEAVNEGLRLLIHISQRTQQLQTVSSV